MYCSAHEQVYKHVGKVKVEEQVQVKVQVPIQV